MGQEVAEATLILAENGEVLLGLHHLCPMCFAALGFRPMPEYGEKHWHCESCGTEWSTADLLAAYRQAIKSGHELKEEEWEADYLGAIF